MMHILIKICSPVDRFDALRPGLDVETGCIPPGSNSRHNLSVTQRWGCGLYGQVNRLNIASSKLHQPDTSSMLGWGHHLFSYKASVKSLDVKQLKCIEAVSARRMHSISEEIKYGIVLTSPFSGRLPRDINGIRDRYFLKHLSLI